MAGSAPHGFGTEEDPRHSIIVAGGNGIVFVIVTAGTGDTERHHAGADNIDLIVDHVHVEVDIHGFGGFGTEGQKASSDQQTVAFCGRFRWKQVTRYLFGEETIVGEIIVECLNDVVAVPPGMGESRVATEAVIPVRFTIAGYVEPVPPPAFTKMRRGQQLIDQCFYSGLLSTLIVVQKSLDLFQRGGETGQVII